MSYKLPWDKDYIEKTGLIDDPVIVKEKLKEMREIMDEIMQDDDLTGRAKEMLQYMFCGDEERSPEDLIRKAYEYTHCVVATSLSHVVTLFVSDKSIKIASECLVSDELDEALKKILDNGKDILGGGNGT